MQEQWKSVGVRAGEKIVVDFTQKDALVAGKD
jgi:hypothetical protein